MNMQDKLRFCPAECRARRDRDRPDLVRRLSVPPARQEEQRLVLNRPQNHQTWAPSAARSRRATPPLVISDATIVPAATTAIMIVHTALISGFTPSRTSE